MTLCNTMGLTSMVPISRRYGYHIGNWESSLSMRVLSHDGEGGSLSRCNRLLRISWRSSSSGVLVSSVSTGDCWDSSGGGVNPTAPSRSDRSGERYKIYLLTFHNQYVWSYTQSTLCYIKYLSRSGCPSGEARAGPENWRRVHGSAFISCWSSIPWHYYYYYYYYLHSVLILWPNMYLKCSFCTCDILCTCISVCFEVSFNKTFF